MTEERALYTTDEVMQMRVRIEMQRKQLDEMKGLRIENELLRERAEALRKTVDGFSDASSFQWGEYQRRIKLLEAANERLKTDNRRMRRLDSIPLDAIERYHAYTHYDVHAANDAGYTTQQFDADDAAIGAWLDGDA